MELVTLPKHDNITYTVLVHPDLAENENIMQLARDYRKHRNNEVTNLGLFGRDAAFTENKQLQQSCIFKVHLIKEDQYNFRIDQFKNTSDSAHLIYCEHLDDITKLCIVDILTPEAHKQAYKVNNIDRITNRAEDFHSRAVKKEKIA
jgi:mRNA interferase YafO